MLTMTLTRETALNDARRELHALAERVLASREQLAPRVNVLVELWEGRLVELSRMGSHLPVPRETQAALDFLSQSICSETLDPDAQLRWLDAYPDAVADLFPPSAVTYRLVDDDDSDTGGAEAAADAAGTTRSIISSAA
jgi:hypothetical protein